MVYLLVVDGVTCRESGCSGIVSSARIVGFSPAHEIAIDFLLSRYNIRNPIFFIDFHYCRLWEH